MGWNAGEIFVTVLFVGPFLGWALWEAWPGLLADRRKRQAKHQFREWLTPEALEARRREDRRREDKRIEIERACRRADQILDSYWRAYYADLTHLFRNQSRR